MAGAITSGAKAGGEDADYQHILPFMLAPTWLVIGIFLVAPVIVMALYSFLTRELRGGVEWSFTLTAYDQFSLDRGFLGGDPPRLQWTYLGIYWRSIWQAALATVLCLLIGFPTAWFIALRPPAQRAFWLFLITVSYWVNLLIRNVSMRFLLRD